MKRFCVLCCSVLAGFLSLTGCSEEKANQASTQGGGGGKEVLPRLVIAMDATYPPFEYTNETGEFAGVSVDLGNAIGEHLGRKVEFRNINFDGLIAALKSGSVDIIISSVTASDERRKSVDFSDPYVKTGLAMLLWKDSPVQKVEDLNDPARRVVVRLGTTGEQYVRQYLPKAQVIALDGDTACVMEVVKGGVDAWIYDQLSLMNYHDKQQQTTRVLLKPLREEVWAVALRQGDTDLKEKINECLAKLRKDGTFNKLAEKHLTKEKKMMEEQGIPFVFDL
ncbi:transporter substrate-binding domain-containing protein [Roseimicrobium sp. ORNL1]|uniref:transporter substrate-binding domain-containing protein n=1 Tax=Roseimicrobium sp. ORNL1 TaxID=2711231 RepID=UPI001F0FBFD1|nr:transporter substrate-binding domain-containing protein [Roseimicrobium sp. ORNL1]